MPQGKGKAKEKPAYDFEDDLPSASADVLAAEILSVERHSKADKLKVCKVETGAGIFKVARLSKA